MKCFIEDCENPAEFRVGYYLVRPNVEHYCKACLKLLIEDLLIDKRTFNVRALLEGEK